MIKSTLVVFWKFQKFRFEQSKKLKLYSIKEKLTIQDLVTCCFCCFSSIQLNFLKNNCILLFFNCRYCTQYSARSYCLSTSIFCPIFSAWNTKINVENTPIWKEVKMLPLFLLVTQCLQKTEAASISGENSFFFLFQNNLNKQICFFEI